MALFFPGPKLPDGWKVPYSRNELIFFPKMQLANKKRLSSFPIVAMNLLLIACVAFAVRMMAMFLAWHKGFGMPYGYEAGRIAASIASGRGFSSPLASVETGPTAWLCPIFPYLIAGIFRLWGIFTSRSLMVIQIIDCAFASLTVFPIYALGNRAFGREIALAACWLWVALPSAIHTPIQDIWDTALTALLLACIFAATFAIDEAQRIYHWLGYGALWGIAVLVNPAVLSLFPFLLIWLGWRAWKTTHGSARLLTAILGCCLLVVPWSIRNHLVLGAWVPLRSNFGVEFWLGNNPDAANVNSFQDHPFVNAAEAADFKRLGEISYATEKRHEAELFIRSHPASSSGLLLRRMPPYWFAVTDRPGANWSSLPLSLKMLVPLNLVLVLLAWFGMIRAVSATNPFAFPFAAAFFIFPLPYYVTHVLVRYRFPLEPIIVVLGIYGLACAIAPFRGLMLPELGVQKRSRSSAHSPMDLDE